MDPAQVLLADGRRVPLTAAAKKKYQAEVDTMAASALRCLAFAQKTDLPAFAGYDGDLHHPVSPPLPRDVPQAIPHMQLCISCSKQSRTLWCASLWMPKPSQPHNR